MQGILMVLALAVTVEAVVEYVKAVVHGGRAEGCQGTDNPDGGAGDIPAAVLCRPGLTCMPCWVWISGCPASGPQLTGIFASRGANYMNDLIQKLRQAGEAE